MNDLDSSASPNLPALTNGSGAAAILSAATGCFALAILAIACDKSALVKRSLVFYKPTGPITGVTAVAIIIWLLTWGILECVGKKDHRSRTHQCHHVPASGPGLLTNISAHRRTFLKPTNPRSISRAD